MSAKKISRTITKAKEEKTITVDTLSSAANMGVATRLNNTSVRIFLRVRFIGFGLLRNIAKLRLGKQFF